MPVLTIALDAMGGDLGPPIILSGAIKALQTHPNLHIIACGDAQTITGITAELNSDIASRITIHHAKMKSRCKTNHRLCYAQKKMRQCAV